MNQTWTIEASNSGQRLDVFLAAQLPELTRSAIAKQLKQGAGTVNDKPATVHRFLKTGDIVKLGDAIPRKEKHKKSITSLTQAPLAPLDIIAETDDWIVINKPIGLLVHPDRYHPHGTLVDLLLKHYPKMRSVGEDPSRPGIMHRLDREVSGLMVIAKNQEAFDGLKRQFAEHSVDKRYLALVQGDIAHEEGDIKFRIARSTSRARMAARPEHQKEGQAAWTHYVVLKRLNGATLCQLTILSGRTHQIRAHMHGLGHPVLGDQLYKLHQADRKLKVPRLMLQSVYLSFKDPITGDQQTFTLAPEPEFATVEKELSVVPLSKELAPHDNH